LQQQCALADGKFRLGADAEKLRRFVLESIVMIRSQLFERRPLLTLLTNKLPLILTDRAARRRLGGSAKLSAALNADEVFHRDESLCSGDL
jgi:hypothetical protein